MASRTSNVAGRCTFQLHVLHTSDVGERATSDVETAWTGQSEKSGPRGGTATRRRYNVGHTVGEDIIAVLISRGETVSQHVSIDVLCGRYGR